VSGAARIKATTQTPVPARERPRWSMWDLQHIGQRCRRNLHGGCPRRLVPGSRARALRRWKATCPSESARGRAARYILAAEAEMNHRHLGRSGLMVSEIAYGNWLTHGAQVDKEAAFACVRAALEEGITTFDTADVYAQTRAEEVMGEALAGQRREGLEICTKLYWPVGPGQNDRGLSRKHVFEAMHGSLRRLRTDYVDLYQAHRYDVETPLEETMLAFADLVRQGKALYIGVSEWNAEQITRAAALARDLRVPFVSNQPQYSMLWRVIEAEVIPASAKAGLGQIVWSPLAQGVLTGKY